MAKVDSNFSICYKQTWKRKTTPQQRSILAHTAQAPRTPKGSTKDNDSIGSLKTWATPLRSDGGGGPRNVEIINGRAVRVSKETGMQFGINLADESKLSVWPTPTASDKKVSRRTTTDKQKWMNPNDPQHTSHTMLDVATLSVWPTPTARDHKDQGSYLKTIDIRKDGRKRLDTVPRIANIADQTIRMTQDGITISSGVEIKSGVQLSVEHSRWLMQLPTGYISSRLLETPFQRTRQKSS